MKTRSSCGQIRARREKAAENCIKRWNQCTTTECPTNASPRRPYCDVTCCLPLSRLISLLSSEHSSALGFLMPICISSGKWVYFVHSSSLWDGEISMLSAEFTALKYLESGGGLGMGIRILGYYSSLSFFLSQIPGSTLTFVLSSNML